MQRGGPGGVARSAGVVEASPRRCGAPYTEAVKAVALMFLCVMALAARGVLAQSYPSKPVRVIVPFAQRGRPGSRRGGWCWGGDGARPPGLWHRVLQRFAIALVASASLAAGTSFAQSYPSKPVRVHRSICAKAAPRISARGLVLGRRRGAAAGVMAPRSPAICHRAGRVGLPRCGNIVRSIVSIEAGAGHRSVCARRRQRHPRARARAQAHRIPRPAFRRGQPGRRRRPDRRRDRGPGGAGRLHDHHAFPGASPPMRSSTRPLTIRRPASRRSSRSGSARSSLRSIRRSRRARSRN